MRRLVTLLLAASLLAIPSAALAQSAGDEQYADPFGEVEQPSDQPNQGSGESAPTPAAPAQTAPATDNQAVASQDAAAPTLPRTGFPAGLLAGTGALLLAAGGSLRRRVS